MRRELTLVIAVGLLGLWPAPSGAADRGGSEPKTNSGGIPGSSGIIRNNQDATADQERAGNEGAAQNGKPALQLNDADQEAIRNAVLDEDTRQGTPEGFSPAVGAVVPSKVSMHPLPRPLVYDRPTLKQYMYATLDRNVVIVDPMEKRVVAVIALPEGMAKPAGAAAKKQDAVAAVAGLPELKDEQRHAIYAALAQGATDVQVQPVPDKPLLAGTKAPPTLQLAPMPQELVARVPQVARLQYGKLQDGRVVLVDPAKGEVAGIITADDGQRAGAEPNKPATAARDQGGGNNVEGRGQAPGATAAESVPSGGSTGSGGAMSQ
ncbi:MAG TPA: DUF1236 domain-containing protein [Xanthobacteraceae bacterium]|nr:DUF1236 domain-containing protein [Xanthobacteraceae bacterium]